MLYSFGSHGKSNSNPFAHFVVSLYNPYKHTKPDLHLILENGITLKNIFLKIELITTLWCNLKLTGKSWVVATRVQQDL